MLDIEGIVRDWINTRSDLVGPGRPLTAGAHLKRIRHHGCYAYVISIGTPTRLVTEVPTGKARISVTVYGITKDVAVRGAVAYGNILEQIQLGHRERMGDHVCLAVDNIVGPTPIDDQLTTREEYRYLVDADFWVAA